MLLSRWIKPERLIIELIERSPQLNFGLRNYQDYSIRFAKYKFDSNDSKANLKTWLSAGGYKDTQYIGFFELDSIRNWLNIDFTVDEKKHFETNSFFIFNLDQVFSLSGTNFEKRELQPTIRETITRENNVLKYFNPPSYDVFYEDGTFYKTYSNSGEIDIVASNMAVYGILSNSPINLMLSNKDSNDTLNKNYSDINIKLINHVLDKMKEKSFTGVYDNLLNLTELNKHFTKVLQDIYYQQLEALLNNSSHPKYKDIKKLIEKMNDIIEDSIIIDGENIRLNPDMKYEVKISTYSRIFDQLKKNYGIIVNSIFNIKMEENKYINEHFIGALLNIASFLNNPITNIDTITIFTEVNAIANEYYEAINAAKDKIEEAKTKYIGIKRRYTGLKSLYSIESIM
jgi:hypothetical protein